MKKEKALEIAERELKDLDVAKGCTAYGLCIEQVTAGAKFFTTELQLVRYIEEFINSLSNEAFHS